MPKWCTGGAQAVPRRCPGGAQVVPRWCAGGAQMVPMATIIIPLFLSVIQLEISVCASIAILWLLPRGCARIVPRWCPSGAQAVSRWCPGGAQVVHRWCPGGAQVVPMCRGDCPRGGGDPFALSVLERNVNTITQIGQNQVLLSVGRKVMAFLYDPIPLGNNITNICDFGQIAATLEMLVKLSQTLQNNKTTRP